MLPEPAAGHATATHWVPVKRVTHVIGLGKGEAVPTPRPGEVSRWLEGREYITRNTIDRWHAGRRYDFTICEGADGSKLRLLFRGPHRVDNLKIETVSPTEVPDTSELVKALESIPLEKRVHNTFYDLPELKTADKSRKARAYFMETSPYFSVELLTCNNYDPKKYPKQSRSQSGASPGVLPGGGQ